MSIRITGFWKRSVPGLLLAVALAAPALAQPSVLREGEGQRRRQLDSLELKPFSIGNLDKLSDWTNGSAPTTGAIDGKVVVILFWNDWYPQAAKAVNFAKRLAEKHKGEVVVIAAHDKEGWTDARKAKSDAEGAMFLIAHDTKNELRAALKADQDPDFFIIDRAGQLRYADVQTESVEAAVDFLVGEGKDKAAGLTGELAAKARQAELDRRRSESIRTQVDMTGIPEVPFQMPLPEAYSRDKVTWPKMPKEPNDPPEDPKNPTPPVVVPLPDVGYFPQKPTVKGRAVVLYFWHPDYPATYQLFEPMNALQRQYPRDLAVIGVMSPLKIQTANGSSEYKLDTDPKSLTEKIEKILARQNINHSLLLDINGSIFELAKNKKNEIPLPWGAVISTDNAMRFSGFMGASTFQGALDRVLQVDPGIRARRAAEEEFLRSKNK